MTPSHAALPLAEIERLLNQPLYQLHFWYFDDETGDWF